MPLSSSSTTSSSIHSSPTWSWSRLEREVLAGENAETRRRNAIEWARGCGLLRAEMTCENHDVPMTFHVKRPGFGQFRCPRRGRTRPASGEERSAAYGTWFQRHALPIETAVRLMYCWCRRLSYRDVQSEARRPPPPPPSPLLNVAAAAAGGGGGGGGGTERCVVGKNTTTTTTTTVSSSTIANWFAYCRRLVIARFLARQNDRGKIGGPGRVVQIDEAKFGRRKYHRGRRVDGHWLLGMIEDGSGDFRLEVCPFGKRSAETLIPLIERHVKPGTTVRTDAWKSYRGLSALGYVHETVNHSREFVTPEGVHTQRIESMWRPMRQFLRDRPVSGSERFADHCIEYLWRRSCRQLGEDTFAYLVDAIREAYRFTSDNNCHDDDDDEDDEEE